MQPFLKWAGGKRWLFDEEFVASLPTYVRYIEPFLGGAAGFFAVEPRSAILADLNPELINLYEVVRDEPIALATLLDEHQASHSKDYYYRVRTERPSCRLKAAGRMLYLNRTCWNGLYRLNMNGEFNVPIGTKTLVSMPSDNFVRASELLRGAKIRLADFQSTIAAAGEGDLLFVDPPYTVKHNMNGFVKYNEKIFQWSDQVRLRDALVAAHARGAHIILTNANHASVREIYQDFGRHSEVRRQSVISGKRQGRSEISELMVRT